MKRASLYSALSEETYQVKPSNSAGFTEAVLVTQRVGAGRAPSNHCSTLAVNYFLHQLPAHQWHSHASVSQKAEKAGGIGQ